MPRVMIDDGVMKQLQRLTRTDSAVKVTEDALTLLNWAAGEVKNGRQIYSSDPDAKVIHRLAMPSLTRIQD